MPFLNILISTDVQETRENVKAFITAVHILVEHWAFGALREELVRDSNTVGVHDTKLSE